MHVFGEWEEAVAHTGPRDYILEPFLLWANNANHWAATVCKSSEQSIDYQTPKTTLSTSQPWYYDFHDFWKHSFEILVLAHILTA